MLYFTWSFAFLSCASRALHAFRDVLLCAFRVVLCSVVHPRALYGTVLFGNCAALLLVLSTLLFRKLSIYRRMFMQPLLVSVSFERDRERERNRPVTFWVCVPIGIFHTHGQLYSTLSVSYRALDNTFNV